MDTGPKDSDTFLTPTPDESNWAVGAHLSGFVLAYVALGIIGPVLVYFFKGNDSRFVRAHAIEAINFNITVLIGIFVSVILMVIVVGFITLGLIGLAYLIFTIKGALAARDGKMYRYPFTLRFIK